MTSLFEHLETEVAEWRVAGYPCEPYPLIGEILSYQRQDLSGETEDRVHHPLKFLRPPQFLALEVYWYVRLVLKTPHIMNLYKKFYGDDSGDIKFMQNALLFAPGTTIIESLRELADMPFEQILPPAMHRDFLANLKLEFPNKSKEIQAQTGSCYNLIVTNTEKISLRAKRRSDQTPLKFERQEVQANWRLQKIASLPNLGVFSDEAYHTYGNTFDKIKRVRETINYIHEQTPIVAVINTTGTSYYKKQPLKEVLVWYGLGNGIKDNILKSLHNGIHQYNIGEQSEDAVFHDIIREFFTTYGKVTLPNGAKPKSRFISSRNSIWKIHAHTLRKLC